MSAVHIKKIPGWLYNGYEATQNNKQNSADVKGGIAKMVWEDKSNSYRTIKSVGNLAGPILFGLINPTSLSMFSWITPGLAAIATGIGAMPHEAVFVLTSQSQSKTSAWKRIAALAGNSALEASLLMVISTLAQDYLSVPRYVTYPALGVACAVLKVNLNLYVETWPDQAPINVKVSIAK